MFCGTSAFSQHLVGWWWDKISGSASLTNFCEGTFCGNGPTSNPSAPPNVIPTVAPSMSPTVTQNVSCLIMYHYSTKSFKILVNCKVYNFDYRNDSSLKKLL